jgi:glyoxylase-like metal-dependent hydrolase (beta-lactamase superfamily II)
MTLRLDSLMGNSQRLDGGAMFGNVPRAMWSQWLAPDAEHRVPLACRCLLARGLNGKTVLFETGIGAFFAPKMRERFGVVEAEHVLLQSLADLGLRPDDIDAVVLSHLHFDHAGGLLSAWQADQPLRLSFERAQYFVGAAHWQRALAPHPRDRASFIPELQGLLASSGRLQLVDGSTHPYFADSVQFHFSDGHTPGLMLAEIMACDGQAGLVFCADLIPGQAWVHLPVTMGYDRHPELLIDEKRALLSAWQTRGTRLFFTHDPAACMAEIDSANGRFQAIRAQAELRSAA